MIYLALTKAVVQSRIEAIFDFIYDEETGEAFEQKLMNAWYELFGMQELLSIANTQALTEEAERQEYGEILTLLQQTLSTVEKLYEEATNLGGQFMRSGPKSDED